MNDSLMKHLKSATELIWLRARRHHGDRFGIGVRRGDDTTGIARSLRDASRRCGSGTPDGADPPPNSRGSGHQGHRRKARGSLHLRVCQIARLTAEVAGNGIVSGRSVFPAGCLPPYLTIRWLVIYTNRRGKLFGFPLVGDQAMQTIQAVYEDGVFRPIAEVGLPERCG